MYWAVRQSFSTEVYFCICVCACALFCVFHLSVVGAGASQIIALFVCAYVRPPVLMVPISLTSVMAAYRVAGGQRGISPIY